MATLDVLVKVTGNGEAEIRKVAQAGKEAEQSTKNLKQSTDQLSNSFGMLKRDLGVATNSTEGLTSSFGLMKTAIGAIGLVGLTSQLSSFISTAGKFEQFNVSLKVLTGSSANAEKAFAWVKEFTAKTPYTLDETMQAFIRLKAYGIDATNGSLKVLGDTASAMGKPLMSAVEAMADAMVGENERLKEFGIRAAKSGDTIAYSWMDSSGKAKEKIIQNNGEIIKSTLEAIFNEKYKGMMDEQSKTWVGAVSNMEDTWTGFKDSIARDSGVFDLAKDSVVGMTGAMNGQNETLNRLMPIVETLAITYGVMKTASIAATATETLLEAIRSRSTITTTAYNATLMRTVTTTTTLTASQTAMAVATSAIGTALRAIPFLAVAGAVATLASSFLDAKKDSDELNNSLSQTADTLAKLTNNQLAYREATISAGIIEKGLELRQAKQKAQVKGFFQSDLDYKEELSNLDALKQEYKDLLDASQKIREFKSGKLKQTPMFEPTPSTTTLKPHEATQKELDKIAKAREKAYKLQEDADKQAHDARVKEWGDLQKTIDGQKRWDDMKEDQRKEDEKYLDAYAELEAKTAIEQYELELELDKKRYKEQTAFWDDLFQNINKSMESQFFDAMTGKFKSFGDWLKDFWGSLSDSMMRGLSKTLADTIMGTGSQGGGIQNMFSSFGMFGGSTTGSSASLGVGSTLGSSFLSSIAGTTDSQGFKTTNGGTVLSANGTVVTAGTDLGDIIKSVPMSNSYLDTAWNTAGSWFSGSSVSGAGADLAAGEMANTVGGTASGVSGASSVVGTLGTTMAWTAFFKTLSGFLWSDNGLNRLFGTSYGTTAHDAMKYGAGSFNLGQIGNGNAINNGYGWMTDTGAMANNIKYSLNGSNAFSGGLANNLTWARTQVDPLFALTGHLDPISAGLMGGLFGSGETTITALSEWANYTLGNTSATEATGKYTLPMMASTDGGLLGGGGDTFWFQITDLASNQVEGIKQYIGALDSLLSELGVADKLLVSGGTFSNLQSFLDTNVLYSFFDKLTTADSVTVTNAWKNYASSISKSTIDAFSEVVGAMISYKRTYQEWFLGSGSTEQLRFTSDYLQSDLNNLKQSMGAGDVTKDNFLAKYDEAMTALYTPETSEAWQRLGQSLMTATEATKAYNDALSASATVIPPDMMLGKVATTTTPLVIRDMVTQQQAQNTQTSQMVAQLYEVIKVLKAQLTIAQFGTNQGIPA